MKTVLFFVLVSSLAFLTPAQRVELAPLPVKPSTFVDELRALRSTSGTMSVPELVDKANKLLDTRGMNFSLALDDATCSRVREIQQKQKDPSVPVRLAGALKSVEGDRARLALPSPSFWTGSCTG